MFLSGLFRRRKPPSVRSSPRRCRPRVEALETRDLAAVFTFNTGLPDGKIATASRPASNGLQEIESADDFIVNTQTSVFSATFTGLLPSGAPLSSVSNVHVEIYRVFPNDSDMTRTIRVPTRMNSPSDVALAERDAAMGELSFTATIVNPSFTAANSVLNGINPSPGQTTQGEGSVTGEEVTFNVTLNTPFVLPPDHYFFVPQVQLTSGNFFWLSAARPISGTGTTPINPDLQSWIRNEALAPDWLRVGTDIVGAGTFNASFSLTGAAARAPLRGLGGLGQRVGTTRSL
jgi:hypothetical protein